MNIKYQLKNCLSEVLSSVSLAEKTQISARASLAAQSRIQRGERLGKPPFGWRYDGPGKPLVKDGMEQRVIKIVCEAKASGLGQRTIARKLRDLGFVTKRGLPYHRTQVRRILRAVESRKTGLNWDSVH